MDKYTRIDFRDQIARNKRKSFFMIFLIFIIFLILGYVIGMAFSPEYFFVIMILAIIISILYILISYYNSEKIALTSVKAKPASRSEHKMFYDLVEGLTIASGLPMPKLYIMESKQINAFASGRDPRHSVVCVTEGCLEKLDRRELEGVLAHELGHIGNYDMRYMTIVAVMVGMIAIISEIFLRSLWFSSMTGGRGNSDNNKAQIIFLILGIFLAILAPIVVYLVQLSISRKHEYSADATAVKFTRYPDGLIRALKKIKSDYEKPSEGTMSKQKNKPSKALAPMFFANPFKAMGSTHPPIEKRIKALERM